MQGNTSIKFDDFRNWMVSHKNNHHFFSDDQTVGYDYVYTDDNGRNWPSSDTISYKFRYFSDNQAVEYDNLHPEGVYLQLINNDAMILLITPKTVGAFIWGNHYSYVFADFYDRSWQTYQNVFDFHYTSYEIDNDGEYLIHRDMYQFRDDKYYQSIDEKITDTAFARIPLIFYRPVRTMDQKMTQPNERKMVRDIFDVVHNETNYSMPLAGGGKKKELTGKKLVFTGKRGGKYCLSQGKKVYLTGGNSNTQLNLEVLGIKECLIIKIWNQKTKLWNHSVFLHSKNKFVKIFGITSTSNEIKSDILNKFISQALDPTQKQIVFNA